MIGVVALLVAVDEVEQPHVAVAVIALTGVMLVGWMGAALSHQPLWLALLGGSAIALEVVNYDQAGVACVVGVVFALIYLARYPRRWGLPVAVALVAAFVVLDRIQSPGEDLAGSLLNTIALAAAYGISYAFDRLLKEQARTRAALEELRAAREGQLEAARAEERARLAREIHDVLAHTLSALAVQVEGAKLMRAPSSRWIERTVSPRRGCRRSAAPSELCAGTACPVPTRFPTWFAPSRAIAASPAGWRWRESRSTSDPRPGWPSTGRRRRHSPT
jgi:signal transduction histidine kinase